MVVTEWKLPRVLGGSNAYMRICNGTGAAARRHHHGRPWASPWDAKSRGHCPGFAVTACITGGCVALAPYMDKDTIPYGVTYPYSMHHHGATL